MGLTSVYRKYDDEIRKLHKGGESIRGISRFLSNLEGRSPSGAYSYIILNKDRIFGEGHDFGHSGEKVVIREVIKTPTVEERIEMDRHYQMLKRQAKDSKDKYKRLLGNYETLSEAHNNLIYLKGKMKDDPVRRIKINSNGDGGGRFVVVQFSDWHCDEVVTKEQTNGINEYNPGVARDRVSKLGNGFVKILRHTNDESEAHTLVIHLGGDFISGWIHQEGVETNSMSPIEGSAFASELLRGLMSTILDHIPKTIKKVVVICNRGNHGRTTKRMRYSNDFETNYETMIYATIAEYLKSDDRVEVIHPKSAELYVDVGGQVIRAIHGQQIRFRGGVGGINVPLNRGQKDWDTTIRADFNLMCHYHMCHMPNNNTMMNGSLIGYNSFAQSNKFKAEPPMQGMISYYEKYGVWSGFYKINCE